MAGSKVQIQNVPTEPVAQDIIQAPNIPGQPPQPSIVSEIWASWFRKVRIKLNSLNEFIINLGILSTPGIVITDGSGNAFSRTITGTTNDITVTNGTGVSGNPTIASTATGVTPGSYTNTNLTINAVGKITAASNGSGGGGGSFSPLSVSTHTANYTLVLADAGSLVDMNITTNTTLLIPLNSSVNFPIGTVLYIDSRGGGTLFLSVANTGITLINTTTPNIVTSNNLNARSGYLIQISANTWLVSGTINTYNYIYWITDCSTLTGWTNSGATISSTIGNPAPSIQCTGGTYCYIDINAQSSAFTTFNSKSFYIDIEIPTTGTNLTDVFFGCNSSGAGFYLRLDGRGGATSGIGTTTSWTSWGSLSGAVYNIGAGFHTVYITISSGGNISMYIDNNFITTYTGATFSGTYFGLVGDGSSTTGGYYDNIFITG